jgi:hypothetical protein
MTRRILRHRPSPASALAATALFVSLGGTAWAATGGGLVLGFPNSATSATQLTATNNGKALQLTQNSTGGSATALGLSVASGRPPMTVNSPVKVANLNADLLDGQDGASFGKLIAMKMTNASGTLASGDNFVLAPAFVPSASGRCLVTVSTQVFSGGANPTIGPFYRIAIQKGASAPVNDGLFGHYYPVVDGNGISTDMTRSAVIDVTAGESTRFGAYLGFPDANWQGDTADAHVTYQCSTIGTLPSAAVPSIARGSSRAQAR